MNRPDNSSPDFSPDVISHDAERWLDQLVDGELTDDQRRQLLTKLDAQSDGWRRCALAFLEAQSWEKEFRAMTAAPVQETAVRPAPAKSTWLQSRMASVLAVAASFVVAFGLGLASRGISLTDGFAPRQVAQQQPLPQAEQPRTDSPDAPRVDEGPRPQWDSVTVSLDGDQDGQLEAVDVPFATGEGIDEQWLRNQPSPLPPQVLRALERLGHQVERQRAYVPIELDDGRRVVVPVDQFDVHFVGQRNFQ